MKPASVQRILHAVEQRELTPQEAYHKLKQLPFEDLGFAKIDHHREMRSGFPEVIYCEGKTPVQIREIAKRIARNNHRVLATRASRLIFAQVKKHLRKARYYPRSRLIAVENGARSTRQGKILVISAGTADQSVAEEASLTAQFLGFKTDVLYDVGVAGLHRLTSNLDKLHSADVLIVVAGMEGALPSVVAGLIDRPVIAVPTSVGYGASFQGLAALLTMLNSCSAGVAVVNIDNGFGAACMASQILSLKAK